MSSDSAAKQVGLKAPSGDAFAVASALLYHDRYLLPCLFIVLGLPSAAQVFLVQLPLGFFAAAIVFERLAQIAVLFAVTRRWRRKLEQPGARGVPFGSSFLRTCAFGIVLWLLCVAPLVVSSIQPESSLILLVAFLFVFGLVLSLRYYFYFAATALLGLDLKRAAIKALAMSKATPRAALRSAIAPIGLTMLLVNVCSLPFPDGRSMAWASIGAFCQATFWLLSTYSALAFSLILVEDGDWRAAELDPYRAERLETFKVQGRGMVADMLTAKSGMQAMVLAVLLFISNSVRDFNEPPAAKIALKSVEYADNVAKVSVHVSDPEYQLRGFLPLMFSIATRDGTPFARQPTSIRDADDENSEVPQLNALRSEVLLNLEFPTSRTAESLKTQADLWLWYKGTPVVSLNNASGTAIAD